MALELDRDVCYRALRTRDARFDGRFFTAVVSTGIYCRPVCPARTPKIDNCLFLPSAGAAHQMGFRPCLRCRPEVAPGLAGWRGSANTVSRALGLIAEGGFDEGGADELANRLGVGARHLRRLFDRYVGASPVSVAQAHRILFAKKLITETALSMTEIALASGFGSVRRFNDVFHHTYGRTPSDLRRKKRPEADLGAGIELELPFAAPYDWPAMITFLAARAIPGVESVENDVYRRTFALDGAIGTIEVRPVADENVLRAIIHTSEVKPLGAIVARLRRLFDLDADIAAVDEHLAKDKDLAKRVAARPGLRVPGAWDPFELAVRAVLGQQVSVRAATTFSGRLVAALGRPLGAERARGGAAMLFPTPAAMAEADLGGVGLTGARAATLKALAAAVAADPRLIRSYDTLDETVAKLCELPGIGPWTAQYIAMRALREPDAFPAADLGLLRAMETSAGRPTPAALAKRAEAWRPWRAYAALRLWSQT
ncbi:MAG: transcriptional regulator, Ada family/DNA-3-methyladenine glycosylase [Myxococcaceae bacterium]|nr:transcriptional regulator, Ada family/DNA-3-methyladenine glycosylase [Myxococcaceae bacterium]